jgi:hypothetical protein
MPRSRLPSRFRAMSRNPRLFAQAIGNLPFEQCGVIGLGARFLQRAGLEDERLDAPDQIARDAWNKLHDENRTWLKSFGVINVRDIVAVDELGDDLFQRVHIYVPFSPTSGPF